MTQEQVTLTVKPEKPYARSGVIFMATESTVEEIVKPSDGVLEQGKSADESTGKPTPEQIAHEVEQWKQRIENQINDAMGKGKDDRISLVGKSPKEISRYLSRLDQKDIRKLLIDLSKINEQVRRLRDTNPSDLAEVKEVAKKIEEVEVYKKELQEEIAEQGRREQRKEEFKSEETDITQSESSVDVQVFEAFQQYLGVEGATVTVDASTPEVTVTKTADGVTKISVPKPTLENMIAVAKQLELGEFSEKTLGNLGELAKELKGAAAMLDKHVFSPDAIAVLFNAGFQLEQLSKGVKSGDIKHFGALDPELFKQLRLQEIQPELQEKILLQVVFGRHDLRIPSGEKRLYDLYFRRWRRQHPDAQSDSIEDQQKAFDTYLTDQYINNEHPKEGATRLGQLLNFLREPIEKSLQRGGKASRFISGEARREVAQGISDEMILRLLDPWKLMVEKAEYGEGKKEATETLKTKIQELAKRFGEQDEIDPREGVISALQDFNFHFQPDKQSEVLDYIPAHLKEKMTQEQRDAVACVIAVAYEQKALQAALGDEYVVIPELSGIHATLLVVSLDTNTVIRVDPSVPKGFKQDPEDAATNGPQGSVIQLDADDSYTRTILRGIRQQNTEGEVTTKDVDEDTIEINFHNLKGSKIELSAQGTDKYGKDHTAVAGDRLVASALLSTLVADGYLKDKVTQDQLHDAEIVAAQQAVRLAPENAVAMKVLAAVQTYASQSYLSDLIDISKDYRQKADEKDKGLIGKDKLADLRVGYWNPFGPGNGRPVFPGGYPPELENLVNRINSALDQVGLDRGLGDGSTLGLKDLEFDDLSGELDLLEELRKRNVNNDVFLGQANVLFKELNRASSEKRNAMRGRGEDSITSFGLTPREQEIFSGNNAPEMLEFIENEVEFFGELIHPGEHIPTNSAQIAQSRLDDIYKILNSNPNRFPGTDIERVFRRLEKYKDIIVSPVLVASAIESGNEREREGAGERADQMDSSGGHDVLGTLLELNGGRAHMLAEELWRIMDQVRTENVRVPTDPSKPREVGVIAPSDYRKIRERLIEQQLHMADELNVGRYKAVKDEFFGVDPATGALDRKAGKVYKAWLKQFKQKFPNATVAQQQAAEDAYFNAPAPGVKSKFENDLTAALKRRITVDVNFAHLEFIIDGRASAIGIRGENDNLFDPTSGPFLDDQYKAYVRYDIFTESKKKVFHEMRISRAAVYIKLRYGEEMWKQLNPYKDELNFQQSKRKLRSKDVAARMERLERFINLNGIELLTPATDKFWENTFIRTKPMVFALNQWRKARSEQFGDNDGQQINLNADPDPTQFGLGLRLLVAEAQIRPGGRFGNGYGEDLDPLMAALLDDLMTNPNDYFSQKTFEAFDKDKKIGAGSEEKDSYLHKALRYKLMEKYISVFYPEEMMKPFAYEPDYWADSKGTKFDTRFVEFFSNGNTTFLDQIFTGLPAHERDEITRNIQERFGATVDADTLLAQKRFKVFQEYIAPIIASIRSDNMNGIDPTWPPSVKTAMEKVKPGQEIDVNGVRYRRGVPTQTNFGTLAFGDFDRLGAGAAENVRRMMAAMTQQVRLEGGKRIDCLGEKIPNSLIARLAYDPMMDHILAKSPINVADVPYWMLHGKDIFEEEHPADLKDLLGGGAQVGRHIADASFVSKGRAGILKVAQGNPAQIEETMVKVLQEEVAATIAGQKSAKLAAETELAVAGVLFRMMVPEAAELIGAESLTIFGRNSRMRKIYGKYMRGMNEAQLKNAYESMFMTRMTRKQYQDLMYEILFGKKKRRFGRGFLRAMWAMFLITLNQAIQSGGEAFQGELPK